MLGACFAARFGSLSAPPPHPALREAWCRSQADGGARAEAAGGGGGRRRAAAAAAAGDMPAQSSLLLT